MGRQRRMKLARRKGDHVIAVAWYRREQWPRLREVAPDPDALEETYDDWRTVAERTVAEMRAAGIPVRALDVDVEELLEWSRANGRPLDQRERAAFASFKLREGHGASKEPLRPLRVVGSNAERKPTSNGRRR